MTDAHDRPSQSHGDPLLVRRVPEDDDHGPSVGVDTHPADPATTSPSPAPVPRVRRQTSSAGSPDPERGQVLVSSRICSTPGCARQMKARAMCRGCYKRWRRAQGDAPLVPYASPKPVPLPKAPKQPLEPAVCTVEGCNLVTHKRRKLCSGHATRKQKYGDVMADVPLRVRGPYRSLDRDQRIPLAMLAAERTKRSLPIVPSAPPTPEHWRPKTRGECVDAPRPCPYVGCRHHLSLDVHMGKIRLDKRELEDMPETCSLDVAERDGASLEEIGSVLGVVRERVRQIQDRAMYRVRSRDRFARVHLNEFAETIGGRERTAQETMEER